MRAAFLLLLILAPPVEAGGGAPAARLVDVPALAPADGSPFLVRVAVDGPAGADVELLARWGPEARAASRTWNGSGWDRSDRYVVAARLGPDGRWVGDVALAANPGSANHGALLAGPAEVAVRARLAGGAAGTEASAQVAAADLSVVPVRAEAVAEARQAGRILLRAPAGVPGARPAVPGVAWLALPPGADSVRADAGAATPLPRAPPIAFAEVVPRGPAEALVVAAPEGGVVCVEVGRESACVDARRDARLVLAQNASAYEARAGELVDAPLPFALPDRGGEARLAWGSAVVDRLAWNATREHEVVLTDGGSTRVGRTRLAPAPFAASQARVLVAPRDTFAAFEDVVRGAERSLVGAVYTLSSPEMAALLADAARRGVAVRLLVEGDPVGGMSDDGRAALAALVAAGADVRAMEGPGRRYSTMHAKVLVADDRRVLVGTENWGHGAFPPDGEGGNRGYVVVLDSPALAARLGAVLDADASGADVVPWSADEPPGRAAPWRAAEAASGLAAGPTSGRLLVAPDHAAAEVAARVAGAQEEVLAAALRLDPEWTEGPFLDAYAAAARGGARVRVLLAAPPIGEDNARAAADLERLAAGTDLAAKVETSADIRLLHGKLWIVDRRFVLLGSLNGNRASAEDNREVVVELDSPAAAAWLAEAFEDDWNADAPAPAAAWAAVAVAAVLVAAALRPRGPRPRRP